MTEIRKSGQGPESARHPSGLIAELYFGNLTAEDKRIVSDLKAEIIDEQDTGLVAFYKKLRDEFRGYDPDEHEGPPNDEVSLDTEEGWEARKELGLDELLSVSPDILENSLSELAPFVRHLPAGHGRGHLLRDLANLTGILQDPELETKKIHPVEMFAGLFTGKDHDIGVSVVPRYQDPWMLAAHAEVGARVFMETMRGIIPPNANLLSAYSIAAHTHYAPGRKVKLADAEGTEVSAEDYKDDTSGGNRDAMWFGRKTDRRDLANFAQVVRDIIVRIKPIKDFNPETLKFEEPATTPEESFLISYGLGPDTIDKSVISHWVGFSKNVFRKNAYTSTDSKFFTHELMAPGVGDLVLLLSVIAPDKRDDLLLDVEQNNPTAASWLRDELERYKHEIESATNSSMTEEEIVVSVEKLKHVCRVVEPADDLEELLESFEAQFPTLPQEDREKWARGFMFMADVLIGRWLDRLAANVAENPHLGSKVASEDPYIQELFEKLGISLQTMGKQVVDAMKFASESV